MKKGMMQIDFIIAIGIFIVVFAVVVQAMITFFTNAESTSEIGVLTGRANSLLGAVDSGFVPAGWDGTGQLERLGLSTHAYRLYVVVNNTKPFYVNQSMDVEDLDAEIVSINYTEMGFRDIDVNSTAVYDGGTRVPYSIDSGNITFSAGIRAGASKVFAVYFDDDSNFTGASASVTGTEFLRKTVHPARPVRVIQHKKLQALANSDYASVKNSLKAGDFRIQITGAESPGSVFFSYGGEPPRTGNVVALQRYFLFQDSEAEISGGKLVVQVW